MKTLEQVIGEFLVSTEEAAAIAEAVRGWMNERARESGLVYQVERIKELEAEVAQLKLTDKTLKIPPWNDLVAEASCVKTIWEEKVDEYPECKELLDLIDKLVTELSQSQIEVARLASQKCCAPDVASCAKEWESGHQMRALSEYGLAEEFPFGVDSIQHVAEALVLAREEVALAAKYDELRAKFPFLPGVGGQFYFARGARIKRRTVRGVFVKDDCGEMIPLLECHPTADACRAAIPVEE